MGKVAEELAIPGPLAEVWDFYFESRSWPSWVDQFKAVVSREDGYPEKGGRLTWRSGPAGRGEVTEKVLEHEPRRLHRISFADQHSEGELTTRFEIAGTDTKVRQELVYGLMQAGLLGPVTDRFFVRSQMRRSITRSLQGLRAEAQDFGP